MTMDSNTSRPVPRADTGSALKNWVSDTLLALVQLERRFDPFESGQPCRIASRVRGNHAAHPLTVLCGRPGEHRRSALQKPR